MIENIIIEGLKKAIGSLFEAEVNEKQLQIQKTRKDFEGDFTIVVFPLLKITKKSPEESCKALGDFLVNELDEISDYNVIKGFLNLVISDDYWNTFLKSMDADEKFGYQAENSKETVVIEYSSPNTNKPLHLGHVRNILLGASVADILKANGYDAKRVNLVNDRGIHICKSMLAWQKFGNDATPESTEKKGDKLVGDFYVRFDKEHKAETQLLVEKGIDKDDAAKQTPLLLEAQQMLKQWEAKDEQIRKLWEMMNAWVYAGFDITYKRMGIDFDKVYYESDTYLLGKSLVEKGLKEGVLFQKEDGSVWADLKDEGLDEKLLLRADGTSVYMTQDLGTAKLRQDDYNASKLIYVVGNEQNYHFDVLARILRKLGFDWADHIHHLSYGMVELPHGKMKSREGTVVDADELMEEMFQTAKKLTLELGKVDDFSEAEADNLYEMVGMGALKYFMLKVDPMKNMLFNPEESVDFTGNTGPFIQYTHARIQSLMRKAKAENIAFNVNATSLLAKEKEVIRMLHDYPGILDQAAEQLSPALIANYIYELVKTYNQFYQEVSIFKEDDTEKKEFRLALSKNTASTIESGMQLLGIQVPERM